MCFVAFDMVTMTMLSAVFVERSDNLPHQIYIKRASIDALAADETLASRVAFVAAFGGVKRFRCQGQLRPDHVTEPAPLSRCRPFRTTPITFLANRHFQETIVSTPGKGGNHAFLTLRADFAGKPGGLRIEEGWREPDWLGTFLPARATDSRGEQRRRGREETATFLAYLRHQRDWLRAIERARTSSSSSSSAGGGESHGIEDAALVSRGVDRVVAAVEEAGRQRSGDCAEQLDAGGEPLVTARRWRRSAGLGGAARRSLPQSPKKLLNR